MKSAFYLLVIYLLCQGCQPRATRNEDSSANIIDTQDTLTNPDSLNLTFGFLNIDKDSVMLLEEIDSSSLDYFKKAILGNNIIPVSYGGWQSGNTEQDTWRQTANNFSNMSGHIYPLKKRGEGDDIALLVSNSFLSNRQLIPLSRKITPAPDKFKEKLQDKYQRAIKKCHQMATTDKAHLILTVFELQNDSALAVLSYHEGEKIITCDFPALYDEGSTWRVDDGGEFDPEFYHMLVLFKSSHKMELVTNHIGAEGYSIHFLEEDNGQFKVVRETYGYSSPL